jgi:hypothetical protein
MCGKSHTLAESETPAQKRDSYRTRDGKENPVVATEATETKVSKRIDRDFS